MNNPDNRKRSRIAAVLKNLLQGRGSDYHPVGSVYSAPSSDSSGFSVVDLRTGERFRVSVRRDEVIDEGSDSLGHIERPDEFRDGVGISPHTKVIEDEMFRFETALQNLNHEREDVTVVVYDWDEEQIRFSLKQGGEFVPRAGFYVDDEDIRERATRFVDEDNAVYLEGRIGENH